MTKKNQTNYREFVKEVQRNLEASSGESVTEVAAKKAIAAVISAIPVVVKESENGRLGLQGFGTFNLSHIAERKGNNPLTNTEITVHAHNRMTLRPATKLKDFINDREEEFDFSLGLKKDARGPKPTEAEPIETPDEVTQANREELMQEVKPKRRAFRRPQ